MLSFTAEFQGAKSLNSRPSLFQVGLSSLFHSIVASSNRPLVTVSLIPNNTVPQDLTWYRHNERLCSSSAAQHCGSCFASDA
jgi:hypothetical protein